MRLLSLACDAKQRGKIKVRKDHGPSSSWTQHNYYIAEETSWSPLDYKERDRWHEQARAAGNFDAFDFAEAIGLGLRTPLTRYSEWHPKLVSINRWLLADYQLIERYESLKQVVYFSAEPGQGIEQKLVPAGNLRFELSLVEKAEAFGKLLSTDSAFCIVYPASFLWPADKNTKKDFCTTPLSEIGWAYSDKYVKALAVAACAGSAESARLLARVFSQRVFYERATKLHFFKENDYLTNPLHDPVKAKEWERVAESLEGKGTAVEQAKFLDAFLFSQDKTPAGLYNIGYALFYNAAFRDRERGLDYLKHAANLGDANAARELGEIHHDLFDAGTRAALPLAGFWYGVAAELGHPNGKARLAYLEKTYPKTRWNALDEAEVRNPSKGHIAAYPASAWYVDVPISDVFTILHDPRRGGIVERMEAAVAEIDRHVAEFENAVSIVQARIDDLAARQLALDTGVEDLKGEELAALRSNSVLEGEQRRHRLAVEKARSAFRMQQMAYQTTAMGARVLLAAKTMGGSEAVGGGALIFDAANAAGLAGAAKAEIDYSQALIDELEAQRIDTSRFGEEIRKLAREVQDLADTGPINRLLQDRTRARALIEGYLRQRILKSGLENCRGLKDYALQEGHGSIDELLDAFRAGDERLHRALESFCNGHAASGDMAVILADSNALDGTGPGAHQRALKRYSERVIKGNIGHYLARASQIDVISDLGLISFEWMAAPGPELPRDEAGDSKLALMTMFSRQFGVTHIGQYDVMRMFSFHLTRHGRDELIAAELMDGRVTDILAPKQVSLRSAREMRAFVERAKESALRGREDQPDVGDLFLRVCAYEYYLPQAVITSGRGNRFKENPEAPVAYPLVNRVVAGFVDKMGLADLETYRRQVGPELDSLLAQTFIDFFNAVGREHASAFADERTYLRDAHAHANYGPRFDTYEDKIAADALARFESFLRIYGANLAKTLLVSTVDEAEALQRQLSRLDDAARACLARAVPRFGSELARSAARQGDHRGENMTEPWRFSAGA